MLANPLTGYLIFTLKYVNVYIETQNFLLQFIYSNVFIRHLLNSLP